MGLWSGVPDRLLGGLCAHATCDRAKAAWLSPQFDALRQCSVGSGRCKRKFILFILLVHYISNSLCLPLQSI